MNFCSGSSWFCSTISKYKDALYIFEIKLKKVFFFTTQSRFLREIWTLFNEIFVRLRDRYQSMFSAFLLVMQQNRMLSCG